MKATIKDWGEILGVAVLFSDGMRGDLFRDSSRPYKWRWRLRARNGRIVADSGQGYVNRAHALKMLLKIRGAREE